MIPFYRSLVILPFVILFSVSAYAGKAPLKFGKVTAEELEMKACPLDPTASAMILYDYGEFDGNKFEFYRIKRIKIFKKEGYDLANMIFPGGPSTSIRGVTVNMVNGEAEESKLRKESIFRERVYDDYYRLKVSMPDIREGSVIDIEYTYDGLPPEWRFQERIPTQWSELIIPKSPYVEFRKTASGYFQPQTAESSRWVAQDVPAFVSEPYMNSEENYISKFSMEVLGVNIPGVVYREYSTNWEKVSERVLRNAYFATPFNSQGYLKDIAEDIAAKHSTRMDKIVAAHAYVRDHMLWDGSNDIFTTYPTLRESWKEKTGSSADINLMLAQLLDLLDVNFSFIALSTVDNGKLNPYIPSLSKLNYFVLIMQGETEEEILLLDATSKTLPMGQLPRRCFNGPGRILSSTKSRPFNLTSSVKTKTVTQYKLTLDESLELKGSMLQVYSGYQAEDYRKSFDEYSGQDEYLTMIEERNEGLKINEFKQDGFDQSGKPVKEMCEVHIKNKLDIIDNTAYLNMMLFDQLKENPFKKLERSYPVTFPNGFTEQVVVSLELPDNVSVAELPVPTKFSLPDDAGSVRFGITQNEQNLQLVYQLKIDKPQFLPEQYPALKEFFSMIVEKHAEPVVLTIQ